MFFFGSFSAFYGQRSVTAAWATLRPWSIHSNSHFNLMEAIDLSQILPLYPEFNLRQSSSFSKTLQVQLLMKSLACQGLYFQSLKVINFIQVISLSLPS